MNNSIICCKDMLAKQLGGNVFAIKEEQIEDLL